MSIKRYVVLILFLSLVLGCKSGDSGPDGIVLKYLNDTVKGNHAEAYSLLSSSDKKVKSEAEYQTEMKEGDFLTKTYANKISYKILRTSQGENKADVEVEITAPDFQSLAGEILSEALSNPTMAKDDAQFQKKIAEKYNNLPMSTTVQTYNLVREVDGWKISLNWEADKYLSEARELKEQKKYNAAIDNYNKALELNGEMVEAKTEIEEVKKEIATFEEKQEYLKKIEIKNLKVGEGTKYGFGEPEPGIFGTIVNNGDRTLDKVQITVYFLDETDTIIGEEDFHPVLVTEFSFGDNKPLKPNYVKDFGYTVKDSAPSTWSGKVKANVTDIEFSN